MAVFRHTTDLPSEARGGVVAIGNFDGVHRGHRAILEAARARAARLNTHASVLTFEPHPRELFQPRGAPFRLSSLRTKVRLLEDAGMANLFVLHFDWDFAAITADSFITDILVANLQASHVIIGRDFRFGNKRKGDASLMRIKAAENGFGVSALEAVADEYGETVSSSRIRQLLRTGDVAEATRLLGRPWELEGRVEHGQQRGREIGFPTANLRLGTYLEPAHGIYAVRAGVDAGRDTEWRDAVAYIGRRPVVQGEDVLLEVHIFDDSPDLYEQHLRVQFVGFVRGDRDFPDLESMKSQVQADCEAARTLLSAARDENAA
jgi:riboflavin kinase/FMN adenylyltransferase